MNPRSRPFLFDIGNVICHVDFERMLAALRPRSESAGNLEQILEMKDGYEAGEIDDAQFVERVCSEIGFLGDGAEFASIWNDIFTENAAMSRLIEELAVTGHALYLLSNTNGLHLEHLRASYPIFRCFAGGVYSHRAGALKPGREIYDIAFETFSLDPGETIYIDDLVDNVATGERLGLLSHHYAGTRHDDLLDWLTDLGVRVAP